MKKKLEFSILTLMKRINVIKPVIEIYVTLSAGEVKKRPFDCAHGDILA